MLAANITNIPAIGKLAVVLSRKKSVFREKDCLKSSIPEIGIIFVPAIIKNSSTMKWLRNILKGATLTTALFVFQACYGTGPDNFDGLEMSFRVVSKKTGDAIPDIIIKTKPSQGSTWYEVGKTDTQGFARIYGLDYNYNGIEFLFEGEGVPAKDTVLTDLSKNYHEIRL